MFFNKRLLRPDQIARSIGWNQSRLTPDISKLEQYPKQLIFVTDSWMRGREQSFVLRDEPGCEFHYSGYTWDKYIFRIYDGFEAQRLPIILPSPADGHSICGEVWSIPPTLFLKLDKLRGNRLQYFRRRVVIQIPWRDGPIVFENTLEDKASLTYYPSGLVVAEGKFPRNHPLAGKKCWYGPEQIIRVRAWMYIAWPRWGRVLQKNPAQFHDVPLFKPKRERSWISDYYKYQRPPTF